MNDAGYISELQNREVKHLQRTAVLEKALGFYALGSWVDGGRTACAALADKGKDAP